MTVFAVTIPGSPGPAKINSRGIPVARKPSKNPSKKSVGARIVLSTQYRAWRMLACGLMRRAVPPGLLVLPWCEGPLEVKVAAYWARKHDKAHVRGLAFGDVDAVAKACLDALQHAGIVTDDAQIVTLVCSKHYDKRNPRIEIEVRTAT